MQRRVSHQSFAELDRGEGVRVAIADGDLHLEQLVLVVPQGDAEGAVVDQPLDQVREPRQQLVEIEDRAHLASDLRHRLERARVLVFRFEEPRVDDRLCDRHGKLAQDDFVARR